MNERRHHHGTQHAAAGVDVVTLVLQQHVDIVELMEDLAASRPGVERRRLLHDTLSLVAAHEHAEQSVLRPVTEMTAGCDVADARTREGQRSVSELRHLTMADPDATSFSARLDTVRRSFAADALLEEAHELPSVRSGLTAAQRRALAGAFRTEFEAARTLWNAELARITVASSAMTA